MTKGRIAFIAALYLAGTFLHELAHLLAGMLLGRPAGFSILPRVQEDRVLFGSASVRVKYKVLGALVAAAPLLWWLVLYYTLLKQSRVLQISRAAVRIDTALLLYKVQHPAASDLVLLWLGIQLLWAGRLSTADLKAVAAGLCSPSGALALGLLGALLYALG